MLACRETPTSTCGHCQFVQTKSLIGFRRRRALRGEFFIQASPVVYFPDELSAFEPVPECDMAVCGL